MKAIRAFFARFRRRPRVADHVVDETGELREFVYLDETSVISLIASRRGAIPASITEALTNSSSIQVTSEAGVSNPLATAKAGSAFKSDQSRSLQIVRQSVVQSQFKLLYDSERADMILRAVEGAASGMVFDSIDAVLAAAPDLTSTGDVIDVNSVKRGDLAEVCVRLDPDPVFAFSAAVSSMSDLVKGHQQELRLSGTDFGTVSALNDVLERLLIGLVPVRARVVEYVLIEGVESAYWVRRSLLTSKSLSDPRVSDIDVVAVTDGALYWRDLRHVLFSSAPYTVLCRVKASRFADEWNPVKMLDILDGIAPGINDSLSTVLDSMSTISENQEQRAEQTSPEVEREEALYDFAEALAAEESVASPRELLRLAGMPSDADCDTSVDQPAQWAAFDRVAEVVTGKQPRDLDRAKILQLRTQALAKSETEATTVLPSEAPPQRPRVKLLECDIVAIYW